MARKSDIIYINYYADGSSARKMEIFQPRQEPQEPRPRQRRAKKQVVYVDPLALCSIAVSLVMLVLMGVGVLQLYEGYQREQALAAYVAQLQEENLQLQQRYEEEVDLEQIEKTALALGMIPAEQAKHITIQVAPVEEVLPEPTAWEAFLAFLSGLFA